jgi:hypothetical protein
VVDVAVVGTVAAEEEAGSVAAVAVGVADSVVHRIRQLKH